MFEVTVILGAEAVKEYNDTGIIPTDEWLIDNGGVVEKKYFKSKEIYDAYCEGLSDADGWEDTMVIEEFNQEVIDFNGKSFPIRRINIPGIMDDATIGTEELHDLIMIDGKYTSAEAQEIDDKIFYFVSTEDFNLPYDELVKLMLEQIE